MTEKKDWWEKRKAKQDMMRAYSKDDYIMNVSLSVFLSFMIYLICSSKDFWIPEMRLPVFIFMLILQLFTAVFITPVKYLQAFDAKIGLDKNWINAIPVNAVFMNLFHVIPALFISAGIMSAIYSVNIKDIQTFAATEIYTFGEAYIMILKKISVDFILSMTFFTSIIIAIARREGNKKSKLNKTAVK